MPSFLHKIPCFFSTIADVSMTYVEADIKQLKVAVER